MTLSWEDVVDKRFTPTKFREGYDQDEVDDFLDEVAAELRRLSTAEPAAPGPAGPASATAAPAERPAPAGSATAQDPGTPPASVGELEARRAWLEAEVERLRALEADYRTRLSAYLEGQLRMLQAAPSVEPRGRLA